MTASLGQPVPGHEGSRGGLSDARALGGERLTASLPRSFFGGGGRAGALERYGPLAARVLISQIFLVSGLMKIVNWAGTEAEMAEHGMVFIPFFLAAATAVELGAGLSLLFGWQARLGALVLFLYLVPVTLTFHHFWTMTGEQQRNNMLFFMHNLALMGGLLLVMACGPGSISLDRKREGGA